MVKIINTGFIDTPGGSSVSGVCTYQQNDTLKIFFSIKDKENNDNPATGSEIIWNRVSGSSSKLKRTVHRISDETLSSTLDLNDLTTVGDFVVGITSFNQENEGSRMIYFKSSDETVQTIKFTDTNPNCPFNNTTSTRIGAKIKETIETHRDSCCYRCDLTFIEVTGITAIPEEKIFLIATTYKDSCDVHDQTLSIILSVPYEICNGSLRLKDDFRVCIEYDLTELLSISSVCRRVARHSRITSICYNSSDKKIYMTLGYEKDDRQGGFIMTTEWNCRTKRPEYFLETIDHPSCGSCQTPYELSFFPTGIESRNDKLFLSLQGEEDRFWYEIIDPRRD